MALRLLAVAALLFLGLGLTGGAHAATPGPVASYGFEEGTGGAVADATGNNHPGSISGAAWTTAGRFGKALSFDGVNDMVTVPDAADLRLSAGMTLEAWLYPTSSATSWRTAILKEAPGDLAYSLYARDGGGRPAAWISGSRSVTGTSSLALNAWTHLTATYDGASMRLYVNGALAQTSARTGNIASTTNPLRFGGNAIWPEWFQGRIDEIRVYNRALSAAEIQGDMNTAVVGGGPPPPPPPGPDTIGSWSNPVNMPLVAVHLSLLPNGKVTMWDGFSNAPNSERVWDPATGQFTGIPNGTRNLFCSVQVKLADGRLAVFGGHISAIYDGTAEVDLYDWRTGQWQGAANMNRGRWYPSATTLSDGRVLLTSGSNYSAQLNNPNPPLRRPSNDVPEIYNPTTNSFTSLPTAGRVMPYFPQMFLLPDGRVFDAGPDKTSRVLNLSTNTWSTVGTSPIDGHSAVMYRPGRILKSGTWADTEFPNEPVTNRAAVIDMTAASPAWREVAPMARARAYHTLLVLPDGKVLVVGGDSTTRGVNPASAVYDAEMWDPGTETWTTMAPNQRPRLYHKSAILLPDGRVLLTGGGALDGGAPDERTYELYSPPYLNKGGSRPAITNAPTTVRHGIPFTLDTPNAADIQSVALMKMGSETHSGDQEQRYIPLNFTKGSNVLNVDGPANPNVAPPGYYMVFIVDGRGVPSVSATVHVPVQAGDQDPPSAPGNLTATGQLGSVRLNWTAASDNVGVTEYRVHRSTTAGFTPSAANRIATVTSGLTYTDSSAAAGTTYHYRVIAADAAGNAGAPSNEASGAAQSDSTGPSVSVTAPAAGATVSGTIAVNASASDNVGVAGVQFRLDGANLGAEDTSSPYSTNWTTNGVANGNHTLTAVARDAAGNSTTSAPVTVNVQNTAQTAGLVASYNFNEGAGLTLTDRSGNLNNGALNGPAWSVAGRTAGALSFDATNDSVSIADSPSLDLTTGMTLEAWVRPTINGTSWRTVALKEQTGNLSYSLYENTGTTRPSTDVMIGGVDRELRGPTAVPLNAWTHLAATYDGANQRLFINGTQVASRAQTGAIQTSNQPLKLGGNAIWPEWFGGLIDDVRVYNRALPASEIQTDMNTPVG